MQLGGHKSPCLSLLSSLRLMPLHLLLSEVWKLARTGENPREAMHEVVRDYKVNDDFIATPKEIEFFNSLQRIQNSIRLVTSRSIWVI